MVAFLRSCFQRAEDGSYVDDGKAMWASQIIVKLTGLSQPPPGANGGGAVTIHIDNMQAALMAVRQGNAEFARMSGAIDITPATAVPTTTTAAGEGAV